MSNKIDEELKARVVRLVNDHRGEYSSLTAAAGVVSEQLGVGKESVRRWVLQSQGDGGQRASATTEELAEIWALEGQGPTTLGGQRDLEVRDGFPFTGELDPATADRWASSTP